LKSCDEELNNRVAGEEKYTEEFSREYREYREYITASTLREVAET
jgi:hypothetical protein